MNAYTPRASRGGFIYLTGILKWVRLDRPNQWDQWEVCLYPNAESLETLYEYKKKGVRNTIRKDDDGYYISLRRPMEKKFKGRLTAMAPVAVLDKDGIPVALSKKIGNGSTGICKVEWYKYNKPHTSVAPYNPLNEEATNIAIRLDSVKILDWVEFAGKDDLPGYEVTRHKELNEQPEQVW